MKINDIFADEVVHLILAVGVPVFIEIEVLAPRTQMQEAGEIANGCVQPDIEILVLSPRYLEAEIGCVARNVPIP